MTSNNPHSGHRKRLKEQFSERGIESLQPHQVLELLLCYALPRKDTGILAHRLIERFGSLAAVLDAPDYELIKVEGIGTEAVRFIKLLPDLCRIYLTGRNVRSEPLDTAEKVRTYLEPFFLGRDTETVFVLCMDTKCRPLCCTPLCEGTPDRSTVDTRRLLELALAKKASCVVLAHNHPGGMPNPSDEDVRTTYRVKSALDAVQIRLVDHFVFAEGPSYEDKLGFISFAAAGYL